MSTTPYVPDPGHLFSSRAGYGSPYFLNNRHQSDLPYLSNHCTFEENKIDYSIDSKKILRIRYLLYCIQNDSLCYFGNQNSARYPQ